VRDSFLDSILRRFPDLDQTEIYEILVLYKDPHNVLAMQNAGLDEFITVTPPWDFNALAVNAHDAQMKNSLGLEF